MRILLLTQNYVPEPDTKMHELGKSLCQRGHQVTVITAYPNYPQGRIYPGYRQRVWQRETIDGVNVVRLPLYADHSQSPVRRSLNYLSFAMTASILGPILSGPADVMLVYHPPVTLALPAFLLRTLRGIPFVYEIQDMWPETLTATGMVSNGAVLGALRLMGALAYRFASAITVISPGFKRNLVEKGVAREKIHVLPNWGYEGAFTPEQRTPDAVAEASRSGRFQVVYAGNMGPAQQLRNVLDAAATLTDLPAIQFLLIGEGIERSALEEAVAARQLTNVRIEHRRPMAEMPALYAQADALLIHLSDDPLFSITIPGKTQSYLASGRPLIVSVNGDAAAMVLEAGAGVAAAASNPLSLAAAVRELYAKPVAEREAMGQAGRRFYLSKLTPSVLIDRYESLFKSLILSNSSHESPSAANEANL